MHNERITTKVINKTSVKTGVCKAKYNVFMYISCSRGSLVEKYMKRI